MIRGARSRRPAVRVLVAAFLAAAVAILGLPATGAHAGTGDTQGTAVLKIGSQIAVTASANPTAPNTNVTLTATFAVIAGNSDVSPTGVINFQENGTTFGTATLNSESASWTGQLPLGTHQITADYDGDTNYTAGVSGPFSLSVAVVPILKISVSSAALPSDGTWSSNIYFAATSDPTNIDYPHTRFSVALSGISGLTASNLRLQQDTGSGFANVPLTDSSGTVVANVGVDAALPSGGTRGVTLQMRAVKGSPAGTLTMGAALLTSADGSNWASTPLATATQPFTLTNQSAPAATTTTVTASNVLTDTATGLVTMTATVVPSPATGTVTFLDGTKTVTAGTLVAGTVTASVPMALGYHSISASYAGDSNYATSTGVQQQQVSVSPPGGSLHAIAPARLLDTRNGSAADTPIAAHGVMTLQVAGKGGIPSSAVAAVALNVTVVSPVSAGSVTVYPTGGQRPATADVDFPTVATTAGLAISQLNGAGQITIYNNSNSAINVIADVSAWFGQPTNSMDQQGRYQPIVPFRLLDTRKAPAKRMTPGSTVAIQVEGVSGIPATGVTAVMLNVTSVKPTGLGYLVTYPGASTKPATSTSQFQANETRAGRVIVGVGTDGKVDVYDSTNTDTDVLVDIVGWFTTGSSPAGGTTYVPLAVSQRLSALQTGGASWGPGVTRAVTMAGVVGIPSLSSAIHSQAVVTDIHTVNSTGASYLTAFPSATKPATSDLDFAIGQNLQNMTVAGLGTTGAFNLYNLTGNVTIPIDVFGWFG